MPKTTQRLSVLSLTSILAGLSAGIAFTVSCGSDESADAQTTSRNSVSFETFTVEVTEYDGVTSAGARLLTSMPTARRTSGNRVEGYLRFRTSEARLLHKALGHEHQRRVHSDEQEPSDGDHTDLRGGRWGTAVDYRKLPVGDRVPRQRKRARKDPGEAGR